MDASLPERCIDRIAFFKGSLLISKHELKILVLLFLSQAVKTETVPEQCQFFGSRLLKLLYSKEII